MRMDSLQKSFLPMWQEETLAKVSRKLDIIDEDDEQKVGQAEQLCYQTGGLCTRQRSAPSRLWSEHMSLDSCLVMQTFSEEFTQLRLFCVKRVAFLCIWLRDSRNRQPAVFALHVK